MGEKEEQKAIGEVSKRLNEALKCFVGKHKTTTRMNQLKGVMKDHMKVFFSEMGKSPKFEDKEGNEITMDEAIDVLVDGGSVNIIPDYPLEFLIQDLDGIPLPKGRILLDIGTGKRIVILPSDSSGGR